MQDTFMFKEIFQQAKVISKILDTYFINEKTINFQLPNNIKNIIFIASGSSYNCCNFISYFLQKFNLFNIQVFYSSEFVLLDNYLSICDKDYLFIFVSQSGETDDSLQALFKLKSCGINNILSVTNCEHSTMYLKSIYKILVLAGEEKSIASTKAFLAQVLILYLVALKLLEQNGINIQSYLNQIINLDSSIDNFLSSYFKKDSLLKTKLSQLANKIYKYKNIIILGQKEDLMIANEGSLKISETSYINVKSIPLGEFLHGHMAILNNPMLLIFLTAQENINYSFEILNKLNLKYDNFEKIFITSSDYKFQDTDISLSVRSENKIDSIFKKIIVFQLLALFIADRLNVDIDRPNGLSKVVKQF